MNGNGGMNSEAMGSPERAATRDTSSRAARGAILLIVLTTAATFSGTLSNGFVWDDLHSLVNNDHYRRLDWPHLRWMFTSSFAGHYQPLSWLSFALDFRIWGGLSATGVHLTNLILHVATAVMFFLVTLRLLRIAHRGEAGVGLVAAACAGTLLFAVHPLRVESVAWATERRDVLSGALLMGSLWFYLRGVGRKRGSPRTRARKDSHSGVGTGVGARKDSRTSLSRGVAMACSLVCFALSLMAKAAGMTFPVVLFLLDAYVLERVPAQGGRRPALNRIMREKLWYAAIAVPAALAALWAQSEAGALRSAAEHPIALRIGQALYGIVFYLHKTVWPARLIPLYEQDPAASPFDPANVISGICVVSLFVLFWKLRRQRPGWWCAWLVYLVVLSPMLGLAQSGPQVVADRYSYLSCMPWAVLIAGWLANRWCRRNGPSPRYRLMSAALAIPVVFWLAVLSARQTGIWANEKVLWSTVVQRAPGTGSAHANLAAALNNRGDHEAARDHAEKALTVLPGNRMAHLALARAAAELGDPATADNHFTTALHIRPNDTATMLNLANIKMRLDRLDEAEELCRAVIRRAPESALAYFNLGSLLAAREDYAGAEEMLSKSLERKPTHGSARYRLAVVQLKLDKPAAAIATLETGLKHAPGDDLLSAKLAWILSTCTNEFLRNGDRAVRLAQRAIEAGEGASVSARESLAAALAEIGSFDKAETVLADLLSDHEVAISEETRARLETQLAAYRQGKPVRE